MVSKSYKLKCGANSLSMQKKSLNKFNLFEIVDDSLATGGAVYCVYEILNDLNKKIVGLGIVVELE